MLNIEKARADTPSCEKVLHFNNAGSSLMPTPVFDAVQRVLRDENSVGGYEAERRAEEDLAAFYTEFAALLNASSDEIAYVENATRAWDMAFYGLNLKAGDRVITHASEYASNYLALLQQSKRVGFEIDLAPSDEFGQIDVDALDQMIRPSTRLIAITHVPTQGGLVNPAAAVGSIAKKHGVRYLLDACQSVGQLEVDVKAIGCDMLSGTGRKFLRGPRGTGFLYVRKEIINEIDPPFIDLLSATWTEANGYTFAKGAKRFENWESYVAGRVGLMAAVRYARGVGLKNIEMRVGELAQELRDALSDTRGVTVHDLGQKKCGIVTFRKGGVEPADMAEKLRHQGINVSVSAMPYARLDFEDRGLGSLVRASVHYFNTEAEVARFGEAVANIG